MKFIDKFAVGLLVGAAFAAIIVVVGAAILLF